MLALLASPYTAQMNLFTASCVYSAFPALVGDAQCMRTDRPFITPEFRHHLYRSFVYKPTNAEWGIPCGAWCPALNRKTRGDKGMASFLWNPKTDYLSRFRPRYNDVDWLLSESLLVWRFGSCTNKYCPNWTPPYRRAVRQTPSLLPNCNRH